MSTRCSFFILNRDDPRNSPSLYPKTPAGRMLELDEPPVVGDLIGLSGDTTDPDDEEHSVEVHGTWRVVARQWVPAGYGSVVWPLGADRPAEPTWLDLMLEPAEGMFSAVHYANEDQRR